MVATNLANANISPIVVTTDKGVFVYQNGSLSRSCVARFLRDRTVPHLPEPELFGIVALS